nr:MAG TPA: Tape measure domain protein [Caudoviricetes sp.]
MAEIDGGSLSFKSILDNGQLNAAIDETLRRVQGFSDAVAGSGDVMDKTTQEMVECIEIQRKVIQDLENSYNDLTAKINAIEPGDAQNQLIEQANSVKQELDAEKQGLVDLMNELNNLQRTTSGAASSLDQIRVTLGQIGAACEEHEQAIAKLSAEYDRVSHAASDAFMSGRDDDYRALQDRADAIKGEVTVRKQLLNELRNQSNALEDEAQKIEKAAQEAENAAQSHVSFRTRLREVREELMQLELAGDTSSERYKQLQAQMGELSEAMDAVTTQQNMLKRGERMWDGLLSGLSGVSGAFSAAQGAIALFSGENENLQKIMLKVQSLMAVTIGLKEVQLALDKDEAFQLVTINGLKEWWNKLLAVGRGEQVASTAATVADTTATIADTAATAANTAAQQANTAAQTGNTVAQGANTVATGAQTAAAVAGTAANIGLAGAFRMVGAAIKSIPVFGWIAAALSALVGVIVHFVSKANEGKKAAQEFYKSLAENAYKPIATIEDLSLKWNALGDDLDAKKKFIEENKTAFDELGVSINGVTDAENLLINNKQAFINAQIEKAKALVYLQQAQEKVKTLLEQEQAYNAMPDNVTKTRSVKHGAGMGAYYTYEDYIVPNEAKAEAKAQIDALRAEITKGFENAATAESNGFNMLKQAGIDATKTYADGTLGAIEQAIQVKQEALKNLTSNAEYKTAMQEIEKLQKQADAITGRKTTTTSNKNTNTQDPFIEKLNKYRSEYQRFQKWVNSGDEVLVRSANQEFSKLLAEGATYIDYLKNQRDQILQIDVANRTKAQNKQLRQLNDAIAEETRTTVLEAFNEELNAQLTNARTVLDMLNIIEQKRKELSGDGTELDNAKADALNEAEENAQDQLRQETESLLEEYASYVEQKRRLEQQFNDDVALMMREREKATTDAQRAEIDNAIQNRTNQYNKDVRNIGGVDYDAMLAEYGTFEERKQAIIDDYDEKRRAAQEAGNTEMVEAIDRAQAQALSKFALDELQAHPDWELMFGDLDEISTKKLQELIDKINNLDGAYLGIEFDPKDLETLKNKIKEMQNEIRERNPFKSLISSIKEYGKAADDESKKKALTNMFESASGAIELVGGAFDAVTSGLEKMGVTMDEQTQAIIGDIGGILDGAGQVASGIATGNPLSIIQGSIGLLSSAFDLFNSRDRKAEKSIKRHQEAIDKLKASYEQLEWAVDKALGAEVYNNQMGLIHNMEQQQAHLRGMISDEQSKKKTDNGKIQDYQNQIAELDRQIQDMYDEIANDILQTNAKDFASTLADSLTEAFKAGEDAANAFEQTVNEVLQNAIVNQLKKKFLENQLQSALDSLYTDMGYWSGDNFIFDGLTDAEIADFKAKVQAAANNYNQALDVYKDLFKDLEIDDDSEDSLTGAVKGVTEETADIIAGQMNAIRINQMEATQVLRQSLQALNTIANNTAYNRLLQDILSAVRELQRPSGDSLRSQGLS